MDKYVQIFKDFLLADQHYVKQLMPRFFHEMQLLGQFIEKRSTKMYCADKEELKEFLDFIDGNGFIIEYEAPVLPWDNYSYKIIPIYREEIIIHEKPKEEPAITMELSVSSTSLYYTPVETYEGYYSECEEYVPPDEVWFCIRGCLELPGLVPTRRSRCARVPRPP